MRRRLLAGATLALALAAGAVAAAVADDPHQAHEPHAKVGRYLFAINNVRVKQHVIKPNPQQLSAPLPKGVIYLVSTTHARDETWQVVVNGPERFTPPVDSFQPRTYLYRATDCTPYDPVFVQLTAWLVPDGVSLPSSLSALLARGGVVSQGTAAQVTPARTELASLDKVAGVLRIGRLSEAIYKDPNDDPASQTDQLEKNFGANLSNDIYFEWTNSYLTYQACGTPDPLTTPTTTISEKASYSCTGSIVKLFDNSNAFAVSGSGTAPSFSTNGKPYCLTSITTYHWNNGKGKAPGSIGLKGSSSIPSVKATGDPGQNNVANASWTVTYETNTSPAVINGTYTCHDSDPPSWSQNSGSDGQGFCQVYGIPATES